MKEAARYAKTGPTRRALIFFCGILGFAVVAAPILSPNLSPTENSWRGYTVLLVDAGSDIGPVLDTLSRFEVEHVSFRNTKVYISDFSGIEEVPLYRVADRLDKADPRYDPYVSSLGGYFAGHYRSEAWHVIYMRVDNPAFITYLRLASVLRPLNIRFRMPEWSLFWFLLGPVMFGLYVVILTQRSGKLRWQVILTTLPLLVLAIKAPRLGLAAAVVLLPGWIALSQEAQTTFRNYLCTGTLNAERNQLIRGGTFLGLGFFVALLISLLHPEPGSFCLLVFVSMLAVSGTTLGVLCVGLVKSLGNEHRVYYPLPILHGQALGEKNDVSERPALMGTILLLTLAVLPALVVTTVSGGTMDVASPVSMVGAETFSLEDIGTLAAGKHVGQLPDLSDYITHRAYQDGLLYSRNWAYPSAESEIAIMTYALKNGVVTAMETAPVVFGVQWFEKVIADASDEGIVAMLLAQGRPVAVVRSEPIESAATSLIKRLGLMVFFLSPLLFLRLKLTTQFLYGMRILLLRRKRQTA